MTVTTKTTTMKTQKAKHKSAQNKHNSDSTKHKISGQRTSEISGITPEGKSRITEVNIREDMNTIRNICHMNHSQTGKQ